MILLFFPLETLVTCLQLRTFSLHSGFNRCLSEVLLICVKHIYTTAWTVNPASCIMSFIIRLANFVTC